MSRRCAAPSRRASILQRLTTATALGWAAFFGREEFTTLIRERGGRK
ncbi:MAG: hypothetical protein WBP94_16330 [Rhodomicrobiaceae bacterium]